MTTVLAPICTSCVHFDRDTSGYGFRCAAYPDGLPDVIIHSEVDHRKPHRGDQEIVFEQDPNLPEPAFELLGLTATA